MTGINGFTFNGVHSSAHGIIMLSKDRTTLPALRKRAVTVMGRHGEYDFGGNAYNNRIITFECAFIASDPANIRAKLRPIAAWLSQKGRLLFDDEPGVFYIGRLYSDVGLSQKNGVGSFTLQFDCEPFAYAEQTSVTGTITESGKSIFAANTGTVETPCMIRLTNTGDTAIDGCTIKIIRRT